MAHISECIYCGQAIINAEWHPECRLAHFEDLIARIQIHLRGSPVQPLPSDLQEEIRTEPARTFAVFEKMRQQREDKTYRKERWKSAREEHLRKCADQWENKHPDPNPIVYG
ncbi:MAG: hypothetical protein G01um101417_234 [Parcubacteria group bacterium Gr01-1014_17]|nr:MAG: hypothetical protein G01um101417_234 [Parcubacteria group bacterium Gr01-1014_17]